MKTLFCYFSETFILSFSLKQIVHFQSEVRILSVLEKIPS